MSKLSPEERQILTKLDSKVLAEFTKIEEKGQQSLVDLMNHLLDSDKEYFLTENEPDPTTLLKKHYAMRSNMAMMKKFLRIVRNAQSELNRREEEREKLKKKQ